MAKESGRRKHRARRVMLLFAVAGPLKVPYVQPWLSMPEGVALLIGFVLPDGLPVSRGDLVLHAVRGGIKLNARTCAKCGHAFK